MTYARHYVPYNYMSSAVYLATTPIPVHAPSYDYMSSAYLDTININSYIPNIQSSHTVIPLF